MDFVAITQRLDLDSPDTRLFVAYPRLSMIEFVEIGQGLLARTVFDFSNHLDPAAGQWQFQPHFIRFGEERLVHSHFGFSFAYG